MAIGTAGLAGRGPMGSGGSQGSYRQAQANQGRKEELGPGPSRQMDPEAIRPVSRGDCMGLARGRSILQ